jgi:hypothetical protein
MASFVVFDQVVTSRGHAGRFAAVPAAAITTSMAAAVLPQFTITVEP